ncbi:hypothetical protein M0R45_016096 [Rubus argutus]|uniref:Ribonuclease n=1 Tax=Rubus argutus TaxID=59490 RepID=A0AAW1XTH5_RUBAR
MGSDAALPQWASEPCIMGIDEAGRGPVLGPMIRESFSAKMLKKNKINLNEISSTTLQLALSLRFPAVHFVVAKKADSLYPVVSGASIAAKVTRDRALREWAVSNGKRQLKLSNFGVTTSKRKIEEIESSGKGRCKFFLARKLEQVTHF